MNSIRTIVILLVAVGVLIVLAALSSTRRESERSIYSYSTYNSRPTGTKGLYLLLDEMNFHVERWRRPCTPDRLNDSSLVFISVAPLETFSAEEITHVKSLVATGATLILFYAPTLDTLLLDFGVVADGVFYDSLAVRQQFSLHTHTADSLKFSPSTAPAVRIGNGMSILYGGPGGHAVIEKRFGEGSVVLFQFPEMVSNAWLSHADNAAAFVHLLRWNRDGTDRAIRRIVFDEFHQGFRDFESSVALLDVWPAKVGLTLAFVLLVLWAYSRGKRFGRAVPLVPDPIRSSLRAVDSIAGVYERADARRIALKSWFRWLMRQWGDRFHTTHPGKLADIFEKRYGLPAADTRRLLSSVQKRLQRADSVSTSESSAWTALDQQEMVSYFSQLEKIHQRINR